MISRARTSLHGVDGKRDTVHPEIISPRNFTGTEARKNRGKNHVNRGWSELSSRGISGSETICAGRKKIEKFQEDATAANRYGQNSSSPTSLAVGRGRSAQAPAPTLALSATSRPGRKLLLLLLRDPAAGTARLLPAHLELEPLRVPAPVAR